MSCNDTENLMKVDSVDAFTGKRDSYLSLIINKYTLLVSLIPRGLQHAALGRIDNEYTCHRLYFNNSLVTASNGNLCDHKVILSNTSVHSSSCCMNSNTSFSC